MSPGSSSAWRSAWLERIGIGAQLCGGLRPLRPHPHRGLVADQRHQRVHRTGRLDVEREARAPDARRCSGLDLVAAVARNLELRHRRALRRGEGNFETPARLRVLAACCRAPGDRAARRPAAASAAPAPRRSARAADGPCWRAARRARATARRPAAATAARHGTAGRAQPHAAARAAGSAAGRPTFASAAGRSAALPSGLTIDAAASRARICVTVRSDSGGKLRQLANHRLGRIGHGRPRLCFSRAVASSRQNLSAARSRSRRELEFRPETGCEWRRGSRRHRCRDRLRWNFADRLAEAAPSRQPPAVWPAAAEAVAGCAAPCPSQLLKTCLNTTSAAFRSGAPAGAAPVCQRRFQKQAGFLKGLPQVAGGQCAVQRRPRGEQL